MTPYRACIFDLDGTLADTLHSIAYFGNSALKAFGFPSIPVADYRLLVGNGADVLMDRMLRRVGAALSPEERRRFRAVYDRLYAADPLALVGAYPGLPEVLERQRQKGRKLAVLSNKPDDMTQVIARELYGGVLHAAYGQRPEFPTKPDPAAVLALAKELGVSPQETLYIGDSGVDMDTARRAGMDSCGVLWGFRDREELLAHGAMYLAGDPAQLEGIMEKQ